MQHRLVQVLLPALLIVPACGWSETVVLRNGYRLQAQDHETAGDQIRLRMPNGGWIAVLARDVARIEPDRIERPAEPGELQQQAPADIPQGLDEAIGRLAADAGIPAELVRAVVWAESGFRQGAVSEKGAIGLMQLMPGTAADLGVDPNDAADNLRGGTQYLRQMLEQFAGDQEQLVKALAAYNAGPSRVQEHGGIPPFPETIAYVRKVLRRYLASSAAAGTGLDPKRTGSPPAPSSQ